MDEFAYDEDVFDKLNLDLKLTKHLIIKNQCLLVIELSMQVTH